MFLTLSALHLTCLANDKTSFRSNRRLAISERATKGVGSPPKALRRPPDIRSVYSLDSASTLSKRKAISCDNVQDIAYAYRHDVYNGADMLEKPISPSFDRSSDLQFADDFPFVHNVASSKPLAPIRVEPRGPLINPGISTKRFQGRSEEMDFMDLAHYDRRDSYTPLSGIRPVVCEPQITFLTVDQVSADCITGLQAPAVNSSLADSEMHIKGMSWLTAKKSLQELWNSLGSATATISQNKDSLKPGDLRSRPVARRSPISTPIRLRGGKERVQKVSNKMSCRLKQWLQYCRGDYPQSPVLPVRAVDSPGKRPVNMFVYGPRPRRMPQNPQPTYSVENTLQTTVENLENTAYSPQATFTTTISGPSESRCPLSSRLWSYVLPHETAGSSLNLAKPIPIPQGYSPPIPHLRGGAESPERVNPVLFWLAGGTGKEPISINGWKQSRPKRRMGGLFGMAVFGSKAGQEYNMQANVQVSANDGVDFDCSASIKVTMEGAPKEASRSGSWASAATVKDPPVIAHAEGVTTNPEAEALIEHEDAVQRAMSPSPADLMDDVPLCSGALPAENGVHSPHSVHTPHGVHTPHEEHAPFPGDDAGQANGVRDV